MNTNREQGTQNREQKDAESTKPCGHVPADPNADKTPCELCGRIVTADPATRLWTTGSHRQSTEHRARRTDTAVAVFDDRELNTILHALRMRRVVLALELQTPKADDETGDEDD